MMDKGHKKWGALERYFLLGGMALIIIASATVAFYYYYATVHYSEDMYYEKAKASATFAASLAESVHLSQYLDGGEEDKEYTELLKKLKEICRKTDLKYVYYSVPNKEDNTLEQIMVASDGAIPKGHHYTAQIDRNDAAFAKNYDATVRVYEGKSLEERFFLSNEAGNVMTVCVPVYQDGRIAAVAGVDITMDTILASVRDNTFRIAGGIIAAFAVFVIIYLYFIRRAFIKPVHQLSVEMAHFILHEEGSTLPDYAPSRIQGVGEIDNMVGAFNTMKADIHEYTLDLSAITAERERIRTELELAAKIQLSNLPAPFPATSQIELYTLMKPAREVGGDFYDYFMIDERYMALVMADVAGKGIPAALFMMKTKTLIGNSSTGQSDPSVILTHANNALSKKNDESIFVTVFLGILDIETGHLVYTNAGHTPPFICGRQGCRIVDQGHDFVLGGMEGMSYHNCSLDLKPGERLFLYTDGVTEAFSRSEALFGEERLSKALEETINLKGEDMLANLYNKICDFSEGVEQSDDITMFVLDYKGGHETVQLELPAEISRLNEARSFAEKQLSKTGADEKTKSECELIVEEIFTNICSYAYEEEGKVRIVCETSAGLFSLTFIDSGKSFNPLEQSVPDLNAPAEEREIGGLGIYLTQELSDEISYSYENGLNQLRIVKRIPVIEE